MRMIMIESFHVPSLLPVFIGGVVTIFVLDNANLTCLLVEFVNLLPYELVTYEGCMIRSPPIQTLCKAFIVRYNLLISYETYNSI